MHSEVKKIGDRSTVMNRDAIIALHNYTTQLGFETKIMILTQCHAKHCFKFKIRKFAIFFATKTFETRSRGRVRIMH